MSKQVNASAEAKGKLDIITFIYGFGAAIVLVGAMFKFLGWTFANELFIVGLSIEAIVFLISAFERKEEEVEYRWEQVFPQLNGGSSDAQLAGYQQAMQQFETSLKGMTDSMQDLSKTLAEVRGYLAEGAQSSGQMKAQMEDFSAQMDHYNRNLKAINQRYDQVIESSSRS